MGAAIVTVAGGSGEQRAHQHEAVPPHHPPSQAPQRVLPGLVPFLAS